MNNLKKHIDKITQHIDFEEVDKKYGIVHYCTGKTSKGKDYYAYISLIPSLYEEYLNLALYNKPFVLEDYGEILAKGWGVEPSDNVRQKMAEKYNITGTMNQETLKKAIKRLDDIKYGTK